MPQPLHLPPQTWSKADDKMSVSVHTRLLFKLLQSHLIGLSTCFCAPPLTLKGQSPSPDSLLRHTLSSNLSGEARTLWGLRDTVRGLLENSPGRARPFQTKQDSRGHGAGAPTCEVTQQRGRGQPPRMFCPGGRPAPGYANEVLHLGDPILPAD